MRLYSTRESIEKGEPSVLAIVETLLAVGLLITLSMWFDTAKWLAGAVCVAPLLLLRTEESVARGLSYNNTALPETRWGSLVFFTCGVLIGPALVIWLAGWWSLLVFVFFAGPIFFSAEALKRLLFKISAASVSLVARPLAAVCAMPQNWRRIVVATDLAVEPELLPGENAGFYVDLGRWRVQGWMERWLVSTAALGYLVVAASYRWSVKATCLVYLPFIWLINLGLHRPVSITQEYADFRRTDISRIKIAWAGILVVLFVAKLAFLLWVMDFVAWWGGGPVRRFLEPLVVPGSIPLWQVTSVLNGLLTVAMWFFCRHVAYRTETGRPFEDGFLLKLWRTFACVTFVLFLYTMSCTLMIVWKEGEILDTLRRLGQLIDWKHWFPS